MHIEVAREVIEAIRAEAEAAHPEECCGMLLGNDGRIQAIQPARNVHSAPKTHFEIDPQALIDAHRDARSSGPQVVGYYHSHPTTAPEPSANDTEMAAHDGSIWAILGQDEITFWRDLAEGFVPLSYSFSQD